VSLDPAATWRGLSSLIPAISIFLAMLSLDRPARRNMVALLFVVVFASVPLDLLQMMGGAESPLRFYAITNPGLAVGFFANANHHAAFMYCAIPLAAGWTVGVLHHHAGRRLSVFLLLLFVGAVVVAVSLTNSRAGMALTFVGGLSCLVLIGRGMKGRLRRRVLFGAIAMTFCALLVAFQFGFVSLAQKVQDVNVMGDLRWPVAEVTTQAALANMPLGTGFGTFVPIYEMSAPRTYLRDHYVNHAHNDWLELWLEAGVAALVLLSAFFAWFAAASYSVWRQAPANVHVADVALARAASIVIVLLALHSAVDYPLRTIALNSLFAVACAFLIQPTRQAASAPHTQAKMS
jgi:O-antigen ligase